MKKSYGISWKRKAFDLGHGGIIVDRCYSALVKDGDKYKSQAYIKAFKKETTGSRNALEEFADKLSELEDDIYNQKWDYIFIYSSTYKKHFSEDRTDELVSKMGRCW